MSATRMSCRLRSILVGVCTVVGLSLCVGCSGKKQTRNQQDDVGGGDARLAEDASDGGLDVSGFQDDVLDAEVNDAGESSGSDSEDGGDQTLRRVSSLPFKTDVFYQLSERWAIYAPVTRVQNTNEYLAYLILYDTRNPNDIEVVDHRRYQGTQFAAAARDAKLIVAGDPSDTEGSWIKRFGVNGGKLVEESSFSGGLGSNDPLDSSLHGVVTNGERVIVVLNDDFLEIGDTGTLGFGVSGRFDRTTELMMRSAGDEYAMTKDGQIIEVRRSGAEDAISVWETTETSGNSSRITGELQAAPQRGKWTYSEQTETIYAMTSNESDMFISAFDVSDPANPTMAERWNVETELSEPIRRPGHLYAYGSKLYVSGSFDMFVLEMSSKPVTLTEVARIDSSDLELPVEGARAGMGSAIVTEDSIFVGYSAESSPSFPKVRFVKYERSEIEGR